MGHVSIIFKIILQDNQSYHTHYSTLAALLGIKIFCVAETG
jgi:hypothetical protein